MQNLASTNPENLISGTTGEWEVVVGLEVHAQVASQSKLFSGAATAFGAAPNSKVSLVDAAMPDEADQVVGVRDPDHDHECRGPVAVDARKKMIGGGQES